MKTDLKITIAAIYGVCLSSMVYCFIAKDKAPASAYLIIAILMTFIFLLLMSKPEK